MIDLDLIDLLRLVARHEGISIPRTAKSMKLGQSQLYRMLTVLGSSPGMGGLNLIEIKENEPARLFLTEKGRSQLAELTDA